MMTDREIETEYSPSLFVVGAYERLAQWTAWYEGDKSKVGYGMTRKEAIDDLNKKSLRKTGMAR